MDDQLETVDAVSILFRREVPERFIRLLSQRQEAVYMEAVANCEQNPRLHEPEVSALSGHAKRAFFEALLRDAATEAGLSWRDEMHAGGNLGYVSVSAGRFRMSAHRVPGPWELVPPSVSRKQAAEVNNYVGQVVIEFGQKCPYPKLAEATEIYAYILHGDYNDARRFLQIAIPDAGLKHYHINLSFAFLMTGYLEDSRPKTQKDETEDRRDPKTKKSKEKKDKDGSESA